MLMAMAKLNRWARFYGADNDRNCAMMCVVNMTLNAMYGEVAWMNTLSQQWYGGWVIEPTIHCCPRVREITEEESYIKLRVPEKPKPELPQVGELPKPGPQLVFEF